MAILSKLVDFSVVGDDAPIPLLQRPGIQAARTENDPRRLLEMFSGDVYAVMTRMSPIFSLLRTAAKSEPEIAALLERLLAEYEQALSSPAYSEAVKRSVRNDAEVIRGRLTDGDGALLGGGLPPADGRARLAW